VFSVRYIKAEGTVNYMTITNMDVIKLFILSNRTYVHVYIMINTQLATCFGSSEPSSGR
jgi:hypothetical protein